MNDLKDKNIYPFGFVKYPSILGVFIQLMVAGLPILFFYIITFNQNLVLYPDWIYLPIFLMYIWYFWWFFNAVKQINVIPNLGKQWIAFLLVCLSLAAFLFSLSGSIIYYLQ